MNRTLLLLSMLSLSMLLAPVGLCQAQVSATQPGSRSLADSTILVLPIEPPSGNFGWVGRAIQQDILVDLTQMTRAHVLAPASAPILDTTAALNAGRQASAHYVVFGAAQSSGTQVRVTGQVLDVSTGQSLANLKATAPADDLFPLEDALAIQVVRALPGAAVPATATAPAGSGAEPQPLPQVVYGQPYVSEVTPAPQYDTAPGPGSGYGPYVYGGYPYGYPYYYPYPYWGFYGGAGVVIIGHHFHDHGYYPGFDHRPYVSPHVNPGIYSHGYGAHGAFRGPGFGPMPGSVGGSRGMGAARGTGGMSGVAGHAGGAVGGGRGR